MKHIRVVGDACSGKSMRAQELFYKFERAGDHVVLVDCDAFSSHPDRSMARCDTLITVHAAAGPLSITVE